MKENNIKILLLLLLMMITGCIIGNIHVLLFNKANGFVHKSIDSGSDAIKKMENEYPFVITVSDDSLIFRDSSSIDFDVILFMSTSGVTFDEEGRAAFQKFIRSGGGFVGVHGASTIEYDWNGLVKC